MFYGIACNHHVDTNNTMSQMRHGDVKTHLSGKWAVSWIFANASYKN